MLRVLSHRKGKGRGRRTSTTGNVVLAKNAAGQHTSTTRGCRRTSKRSCGDQTAMTDAPPAKRTTRCTRSTTEESQPSALTEADILRIVDAIKKGLSDIVAGTQGSDTRQTDEEEEEDFNPIGECMVHYCW